MNYKTNVKKNHYKFTILGCGSSPGVPRSTGDWGACDPKNYKNKRKRPAFLIERFQNKNEKTTIVIDTGPDFREQMIFSEVKKIDAVLYTHPHADHTHGIDDLRSFCLDQKKKIDIYSDEKTLNHLSKVFSYCFETPAGSSYPPLFNRHKIRAYEKFWIKGSGGDVEILPIEQQHGSILSLGYKIGQVAYCTDVSNFSKESLEQLKNIDILILDCLQYKDHPSHLSLEKALNYIEKIAPRRVILTHMHIALDYDTLQKETPNYVEPAYDGLTFTISI